MQNIGEIRASSQVIRKDEQYSLWSTPAGEFWVPAASGDSLIYDLSEQKRDIYGKRVYSGDIVLDAGANVGVFTRRALASGAKLVVAIDPAPNAVECLRRNFRDEIAAGRVAQQVLRERQRAGWPCRTGAEIEEFRGRVEK